MAFVLMLGASVALAADPPGGKIGMFADQAGTNCSITDTAPGLLPIYVVHIVDAGATAIQYIAAKPACMTSTYLSDTNPFGVTIGNSQTGVSVGYGTCRSGAIHCQTISYFASGTTPACCVYTVHCDPLGVDQCASGLVDIVDCDFGTGLAKGRSGVINQNASCDCATVPVEETSWGQIKSLYDE